MLEGISRGFSAVNIRKFVLKAARLGELVELGTLSAPAAVFLEAGGTGGCRNPRSRSQAALIG